MATAAVGCKTKAAARLPRAASCKGFALREGLAVGSARTRGLARLLAKPGGPKCDGKIKQKHRMQTMLLPGALDADLFFVFFLL